VPQEVIISEQDQAARRRRVRSLTLRLVLFAVAVYIAFIIVFLNKGP
jgi:hypothetical protein